jgi:hypothetical protein
LSSRSTLAWKSPGGRLMPPACCESAATTASRVPGCPGLGSGRRCGEPDQARPAGADAHVLCGVWGRGLPAASVSSASRSCPVGNGHHHDQAPGTPPQPQANPNRPSRLNTYVNRLSAWRPVGGGLDVQLAGSIGLRGSDSGQTYLANSVDHADLDGRRVIGVWARVLLTHSPLVHQAPQPCWPYLARRA